MKDEIKEIKISKSNHSIVIIKNGITVKEQFSIDDEILDYITNLQEENKKNKTYSEFYKDMSDKWKDMSDVFKKNYEDYKSRNEKAIEYIKQHQVRISIAEEKELGFCDEFDIFSSPYYFIRHIKRRR